MLDIGIGRYDNTSYFLPVHGILRADRSPIPALWEVRQVLAPFELSLSDEGARIKSLLRFACAKTLALRWSLCEDGVPFELSLIHIYNSIGFRSTK